MIKSLGIDVGSSSIKVVELHSSSKSDQIFQFFEHPLDLNPAKDNKLEIIEYLRNLLSQYDPSQTRFSIGFKQNQVVTRLLKFPFSDKNKINKTLGFELEDQIPFSIENTLFEGKITSTKENETEVLAASVLRDMMDRQMSFAKDINIDPTVIGAEGFAYANIVENWKSTELNSSALHVLLHIGHSHVILNVFKNNVLVATRTLTWGGKNIAEAIQKKYDIPFVEAIKELKTKGFVLLSKEGASRDQAIFSDVISSSLKDLIQELKLALIEIQSDFQSEVQRIHLTGGVSQLKNISPYLTQYLEIPVNRYALTQHPSGMSLEGLGPQFTIQAVALGYAVEGIKKAKNPPLNFRKGEYAKKNLTLAEFREKTLLAGSYLGMAFLLFWIFSSLRVSMSESLLEDSLSAVKSTAKSVAPDELKKAGLTKIKSYIREKKSIQNQLEDIKSLSKMSTGLDVLKKISESLPKSTNQIYKISVFDLKDETLKLEGSANSTATVTEIKKMLTTQALNQKVNTVNPSAPPPLNQVAFAFELQVDRGLVKKLPKRKSSQ